MLVHNNNLLISFLVKYYNNIVIKFYLLVAATLFSHLLGSFSKRCFWAMEDNWKLAVFLLNMFLH